MRGIRYAKEFQINFNNIELMFTFSDIFFSIKDTQKHLWMCTWHLCMEDSEDEYFWNASFQHYKSEKNCAVMI